MVLMPEEPQDAQKGRPARPQHLKKDEVEVKVKRRADSFFSQP
jgi:hypothetical protein